MNAAPVTELSATGNTSLPIVPAIALLIAGLALHNASRRRLRNQPSPLSDASAVLVGEVGLWSVEMTDLAFDGRATHIGTPTTLSDERKIRHSRDRQALGNVRPPAGVIWDALDAAFEGSGPLVAGPQL